MKYLEFINYFQYNSLVILTYFFISLFALMISYLTNRKSNRLLFSSYRSSLINPLTYVRLFTHVIGHDSWKHLVSNFLYILLIGPMIEEKYGSLHLLYMIIITAFVIGLFNFIFCKKSEILGASGIGFMLIVLSSFVNFEAGKIPLTFFLICIFYVVNEITSGLFNRDNISHLGHLLGAVCGCVFGFYFM